MRKKILIFLPAMRIGGAEKILINFIKQLNVNYEVTVALNNVEGELLDRIDSSFDIKQDDLVSYKEVLANDIKTSNFKLIYEDIKYYINVKTGKNNEKNYRYLVSRMPYVLPRYDVAIAYVGNVSTQVFSLADRVKADKKIAWIHGETSELKDTQLFENIYNKFDTIFCVSKISKEHFIKRFPSCNNITHVYYNPINSDEIINKSLEKNITNFEKDKFNILSVGRLSPEKGFIMIPKILNILKNKGYNIKWYLIGNGTEFNNIATKAKHENVEDDLVMMGTIMNPYVYMKECDLYVQPSFEEGYSTTICEAGILGKAIVGTTTSGGIYEQVRDGESAILANPNPEDLAEKIEILISNDKIRKKLEKNVAKINFDHPLEIYKLIDIIG